MKKYELIANTVKEKIVSGEYTSKLPSENELMQQFGVSRVTVRHGLDLLRQDYKLTRSKKGGTTVEPLHKPKSTQSNIKHVVFVMLFNSMQSLRIIEGAEKVFEQSGISLTIKFSNCSAKSERSIIEDLLTLNIDGLIIYPANSVENLDLFTIMLQKNMPTVFVDKYPYYLTCSSVTINNQKAANENTKYLIDLGHKKIAFFANQLKGQMSTSERLRGFVSEMKKNGLDVPKQYIYACNEIDDFRSYLDMFFAMKDRPTGVFCSDDSLGFIFIEEALKRGFRIPEDFSVIGIDDLHVANSKISSLTTARQPFFEIGRNAAQLINHKLFDKNSCETKIFLPTELVIRNSTKAISDPT